MVERKGNRMLNKAPTRVFAPRLTLLSVVVGSLCSCRHRDFGFGPGHADFQATLARDYVINRTSAVSISIAAQYRASAPAIHPIVVECNTDGRFIIAKRQGLKPSSPDNPAALFQEPDPKAFDYWILDTASDTLYGPLTAAGFTAKRAELGVAAQLKLRDVESFHPSNQQ